MNLSPDLKLEEIFNTPQVGITIKRDDFKQRYEPDDFPVILDFYDYTYNCGGLCPYNYTTGEYAWEIMWEGENVVLYVIFENVEFKNPEYNFDKKIFKLEVTNIDPINKVCEIGDISIVPEDSVADIFGPDSGEEELPTILEIMS
jgi:hypothetical protein